MQNTVDFCLSYSAGALSCDKSVWFRGYIGFSDTRESGLPLPLTQDRQPAMYQWL